MSDLSHATRAELDKFIKLYSNKREAAKALGITTSLIYAWFSGRSKPTIDVARRIERLTNGQCNSDVILDRKKISDDYINFLEFFKLNVIKDKADMLSMGVDEYYMHFIPPKIKKIIDNHEHSPQAALILSAVFGGKDDYWLHVLNSFQHVK